MHAFSATMIARGDNTVGLKLLRYADAYMDVLDIIRFNLPSDFEAKQAMLDRWAKRGLNRDLLQKVMNGEIDAKRAYLPNRTVSGMGMEVGELAADEDEDEDDDFMNFMPPKGGALSLEAAALQAKDVIKMTYDFGDNNAMAFEVIEVASRPLMSEMSLAQGGGMRTRCEVVEGGGPRAPAQYR